MEKELAAIYSKIAQKLAEMIPVEWDKVYLLGEVEKGQLSYTATFYFIETETKYIVRGIEIPSIYDVSEDEHDKSDSELCDLVFELNNCFKDNGQDLWEQAIFVLNSDGSFDIDYKYNVAKKDDGGSNTRQLIWAYETFGYEPEEGSYFREKLEKYKAEKAKKGKRKKK